MKLNHITLAAALLTVLAAPSASAQGADGAKPKSREEVRTEAIRSHKDGTMRHSEAEPKSEPFRSEKSRKEVSAAGVRSHKDGTMLHSEAEPKSEAFKSGKSRKDVKAETIRSHKDGTMLHGGEAAAPEAK